MFWLLYDIVIRVYGFLIYTTAPFNKKSRMWVIGRRGWRRNLPRETNCLLFHVASLGEFEQARPLIELIRSKSPHEKIVLSFFSPSGYEIRKDYKIVDHVVYLPLDTRRHAHYFLDTLRPKAIIFTKYDLWFNLIRLAHREACPLYLISASFREKQVYFSSIGKSLKQLLQKFDAIWVLNRSSFELLTSEGFGNAILSGDTRIDRVLSIGKNVKVNERVEAFIRKRKVFIAGSTWPEDEKVLWPILNNSLPPDWCIIIAPHDVHPNRLLDLKARIERPVVFLNELKNGFGEERILIVDTIGHLSSLYHLSHIAYIGGGFGNGIHNTLEPAGAGLPVIFGPNYKKFDEAMSMVKQGLGFEVHSTVDLVEVVENLLKDDVRKQIRDGQMRLLAEGSGATVNIFNKLVADKITVGS